MPVLKNALLMRALLFFLLLTPFLYAEPVWIGSYSSSSGEKLIWEANSTQFEQTPTWSGIGPCPFDITKLTSLAIDYAKGKLSQNDALKVDAIYIQRADRTGAVATLNNKWYLTISFSRSDESFPGSVRILPDGAIIEPRKKDK